MAYSTLRNSRYQREQRFTIASWAVLVLIGALSASAYHHWSSKRSASPDEAAMAPVAPTISMHTWLEQSEAAVNGLVGARNTIAAAASRRDIPATGTACRTATDAVATLRQHMPSPEASVNSALQQAISNYTIGLPDCISASRNVDGQGMQRAARYISQGDDAMQLGLDLLEDQAAPSASQLGMLIV
jgi:hypothetical protein